MTFTNMEKKSLASGTGTALAQQRPTGGTLKQRAESEYAAEVSRLLRENRARKELAKATLMECVNADRQLGLYLKEWRGAEQMELELMNGWVREKQSLLTESLEVEEALRAIRISNRFPDGPVSRFEELAEASGGLQATFWGAGLLPEPHRMEPQARGEKTGFVLFMDLVGRTRERMEELEKAEPVERWEAEVRLSVARELEPVVELYRRLKG